MPSLSFYEGPPFPVPACMGGVGTGSIYIDKPVQRHNLIQTISRVNRKFANKKKGLVVDYIGIKKQMNLALAQYSKADVSNIEEIEASITVVRDHLDLLGRIFHRFDMKPYFSEVPVERLHCLNQASEYVQLTEKIEKRFMALVKRLKAAYDICSGSDAFSQDERDHIHFHLAVRSIVAKLTKGEAPDSAQMNAKVRTMIVSVLKLSTSRLAAPSARTRVHVKDIQTTTARTLLGGLLR